MAWRSGGESNEEMVSNLHANGVISNLGVVEAFRKVSRGFFVPDEVKSVAFHDSPLRSGPVHMSAPHIYGAVVDALDFTPGMSFLNVGSGTGYLSAIAGVMGGPTSLNHGIEVNREVLEFSLERIEAFKNEYGEIADVHLCCGNIFEMAESLAEQRSLKYDRVYVGAACTRGLQDSLCLALKVGGILVAPVGDELVKVTRLDDKTGPHAFDMQVISGVRFVDLVKPNPITASADPPGTPPEKQVPFLPTPVWSPASAARFPSAFKRGARAVLLVAGRAPVPHQVWLEVLGFTDRSWFDTAPSEADKLRLRLALETKARLEAQQVARDAKRARRVAERECERFRSLASRLERQLRAHLSATGGGLASFFHGTFHPLSHHPSSGGLENGSVEGAVEEEEE
eukprot:CAMPEP_0172604074 /NCGR_PEP_ID=MMETSP1068-20121228/24315_1 /TAXON_ID=35684 /ORGANISM="Pseudopedinella elastica, Strain CCMP716" /LENGTH=397 /DNA_ID=CAMNT_0013406017 /DNA_START=125 /DNA_END=1315 /DNA_ORIENTATION=+